MLENLKKEIEDTQKKISELEATLDSIEKEQKAYEERYLYKDAEWQERNRDIIRLRELLAQKNQELKNKQQELEVEIKFETAQRNKEQYQKEQEEKIENIKKRMEEKEQEIEKWEKLINEANETIEKVSNQNIDAIIQVIKTLRDKIVTASQRINQLEEEIKIMQGALEYLEFNKNLQSEELYDRLWKNALKENEKFDEEKNATTEMERNKALASRKAIELNNIRWNAGPIYQKFLDAEAKYKYYLRTEMSKILGIKYSDTIEELDPNSIEFQLDDNEKEKFLELKKELYKLENKEIEPLTNENPLVFESSSRESNQKLEEVIAKEEIVQKDSDQETEEDFLDEEYEGPDKFERIIPEKNEDTIEKGKEEEYTIEIEDEDIKEIEEAIKELSQEDEKIKAKITELENKLTTDLNTKETIEIKLNIESQKLEQEDIEKKLKALQDLKDLLIRFNELKFELEKGKQGARIEKNKNSKIQEMEDISKKIAILIGTLPAAYLSKATKIWEKVYKEVHEEKKIIENSKNEQNIDAVKSEKDEEKFLSADEFYASHVGATQDDYLEFLKKIGITNKQKFIEELEKVKKISEEGDFKSVEDYLMFNRLPNVQTEEYIRKQKNQQEKKESEFLSIDEFYASHVGVTQEDYIKYLESIGITTPKQFEEKLKEKGRFDEKTREPKDEKDKKVYNMLFKNLIKAQQQRQKAMSQNKTDGNTTQKTAAMSPVKADEPQNDRKDIDTSSKKAEVASNVNDHQNGKDEPQTPSKTNNEPHHTSSRYPDKQSQIGHDSKDEDKDENIVTSVRKPKNKNKIKAKIIKAIAGIVAGLVIIGTIGIGFYKLGRKTPNPEESISEYVGNHGNDDAIVILDEEETEKESETKTQVETEDNILDPSGIATLGDSEIDETTYVNPDDISLSQEELAQAIIDSGAMQDADNDETKAGTEQAEGISKENLPWWIDRMELLHFVRDEKTGNYIAIERQENGEDVKMKWWTPENVQKYCISIAEDTGLPYEAIFLQVTGERPNDIIAGHETGRGGRK